MDKFNIDGMRQLSSQQQISNFGLTEPNPVHPEQQQPPTTGALLVTPDSEKLKLIQQQLVLLLHAHRCQKRESQANNRDVNWHQCVITHCRTMKNVLQHMTACTAGKNCTVPHCCASRQIISHWRYCNKADCPVCLPLKQADKNRLTTAEAGPAAAAVNNAQGQMIASLPKLPNSSAPMAEAATTSGTASQQAVMRQLFDRNNQGGPLNFIADDNSLSDHQLPGGFQLGQVTATPMQETKEWHQSITSDLRTHLVHRIVKTHIDMLNKRMQKLVDNAIRIEGEIYGTANSQFEYYQSLAGKIYEIQRETDME